MSDFELLLILIAFGWILTAISIFSIAAFAVFYNNSKFHIWRLLTFCLMWPFSSFAFSIYFILWWMPSRLIIYERIQFQNSRDYWEFMEYKQLKKQNPT